MDEFCRCSIRLGNLVIASHKKLLVLIWDKIGIHTKKDVTEAEAWNMEFWAFKASSPTRGI